MKNIKLLSLTAAILFTSACEVPQHHSFQRGGADAGSALIPAQSTQYTACELVPQFSFEKDEAMEIVVKCEENTSY